MYIAFKESAVKYIQVLILYATSTKAQLTTGVLRNKVRSLPRSLPEMRFTVLQMDPMGVFEPLAVVALEAVSLGVAAPSHQVFPLFWGFPSFRHHHLLSLPHPSWVLPPLVACPASLASPGQVRKEPKYMEQDPNKDQFS